MTRSFQLALAQMTVSPGNRDANLQQAANQVAAAARTGADLVLLPEALDLGWTHPFATTLAEPIPDGEPFGRLQMAAARHQVHVCAGLTERDGDRVFNSAVLIDPQGRLLLKHRKIHELDVADGLYQTGDRLGVVHTPLGTLGVLICADAFVPGEVLLRSLGHMGAEVILSPCAWAVPPGYDPVREPYGALWRRTYGPVARDFQLWIAGASCVGPVTTGAWSGWQCIGNSLVIGPDGSALVEGPYGVEALPACQVTLRAPGT